ncbi:hypothetical protein BSKO_05226 [Bryopsis sp. KO-2023]|nr:hypothetical protein BSKO_05226 [Bryopsis sp. KO-2023]
MMPSFSSIGSSDAMDSKAALANEVPWQAYMTAKLITERELELIKGYDKQSEEIQNALLEQDGPAYVEAFMTVLRNTTKEQVVQYVLALLNAMVTSDPSRARLFHVQSDAHKGRVAEPYTVFERHLKRTDWFTQEMGARLLTAVLASRPEKERSVFASGQHVPRLTGEGSSSDPGVDLSVAERAVLMFMDWLTSQLRRPTNATKSIPTAVFCLASLLRERGVRKLFHRAGGISLLAPILRSGVQAQSLNIQLLYEATLCVWLLSYMPDCAKAIKDCAIPRSLVGVVRANVKEKVTRVGLYSLKNMLTSDADVTQEVVESGLPKLVQIRMLQNWEDEDIPSVLEWLDDHLKTVIEVLSNYEKYKQEVLSGRLDWGPMHTEEQFWRQNIHKLEEKDFHVLRVLLRLLEVSREVQTLAVGCYDLGQFVTYHPHGRHIVNDLRGKEVVMELMRHSDTEVQKNALLCVQKIMLSKDKLDFLSAMA